MVGRARRGLDARDRAEVNPIRADANDVSCSHAPPATNVAALPRPSARQSGGCADLLYPTPRPAKDDVVAEALASPTKHRDNHRLRAVAPALAAIESTRAACRWPSARERSGPRRDWRASAGTCREVLRRAQRGWRSASGAGRDSPVDHPLSRRVMYGVTPRGQRCFRGAVVILAAGLLGPRSARRAARPTRCRPAQDNPEIGLW